MSVNINYCGRNIGTNGNQSSTAINFKCNSKILATTATFKIMGSHLVVEKDRVTVTYGHLFKGTSPSPTTQCVFDVCRGRTTSVLSIFPCWIIKLVIILTTSYTITQLLHISVFSTVYFTNILERVLWQYQSYNVMIIIKKRGFKKIGITNAHEVVNLISLQ